MISEKFDRVNQALVDRGNLLVMFSGGVDSSLLVKLAYDTLGEDAKAVTINSPVLPEDEMVSSSEIASRIGINHEVIDIPELDQDYMRENPPRRCYLCRKNRDRIVKERAGETFPTIADGLNYTEGDDFRPGVEATDEDGIWHPFREFNVTKEEIREWSRELGLSTWDKPGTTCLATRFPYGFGLTQQRVKRVEASEKFLRELGFEEVRVRHFPKGLALVEVGNLSKGMKLREKIKEELLSNGFNSVSLDLEGYKSGKMSRVLTE